jgi:nucleoid-associated protein YgaU
MTSDAKVGLLIGLVFIFIIAFIINGLPSFDKDSDSNELTTNMVGLHDSPPGLAARERKASRQVFTPIEPVKKEVGEVVRVPSPADEQPVRFTMPLPKSLPVAEEVVSAEPPETVQTSPKAEEKNLQKVYVVEENDCLAFIAAKFYGPKEGNKEKNITRIFEANRQVLDSPHEIYVGQKIVIPPLPLASRIKSKIESVFSTMEFKKVESIGKRHLTTEDSKKDKTRQYVVRDGDNLWSIAAEQLGDGSKYDQISQLNADILDDEDFLTVGMRLRLPAK